MNVFLRVNEHTINRLTSKIPPHILKILNRLNLCPKIFQHLKFSVFSEVKYSAFTFFSILKV